MDLDPGRIAALARFEDRYERRQRLWLDGEYEGWSALDRLLARDVLLGLEYPGFRGSRSESEFLRGIRIVARLRHPNIVPIYDLGITAEGRCFFTSPIIEGGRGLGSRLRPRGDEDRPLRIGDLVGILVRVCQALDHAHRRGVLHLNVIPASVVVGAEPHDVFLVDWTLARDGSGEEVPGAACPVPDAIVGVLAFMAPEQCDPARGLSVATDVHGIGAILYNILYGVPPNRPAGMDSPIEALRIALAPKRPLPLRPELLAPEPGASRDARRSLRSLERICLRALELDPARRQRGMTELGRELGDWLESHTSRAKAPTRRWWFLAPRAGPAEAGSSLTRTSP